MRKIEYPNIICPDFESKFVEVIESVNADIQDDWKKCRASNVELTIFPAAIKDILIADYDKLIDISNKYNAIPETTRSTIESSLITIFDYDKFSAAIAEYFMDPFVGFNFTTCHYCDTAYINTYEYNREKDILFFLNTASEQELSKKINTTSPKSLKAYIDARPYKTKNDFDIVATRLNCKSDKYERTFQPQNHLKRHFDLDHVLPKSGCPLVALSLYNFVPSCQICNSNLKGTKILGSNGIPLSKLSPTSKDYKFDSSVKFKLTPLLGCILSSHPTDNPESYKLEIDTTIDPDYEYLVNLFKLEDRYNYHKVVALHWLEQKQRYSWIRLTMMASALNSPEFTASNIQSDIFQTYLERKLHRVFGKMKNDIIFPIR